MKQEQSGVYVYIFVFYYLIILYPDIEHHYF